MPLRPLLHGCPVCSTSLLELGLWRQLDHRNVCLWHEDAETQAHESLVPDEPQPRRIVLVVAPATIALARIVDHLEELGVHSHDVIGGREARGEAHGDDCLAKWNQYAPMVAPRFCHGGCGCATLLSYFLPAPNRRLPRQVVRAFIH